MCTWLSRMLAAAGWLFAITMMAEAMTAEAAPPKAEQLEAWLRDLDAEEYSLREEASRNLIAAGEASIPFLASGAESQSPEAAWRASTALEAIALGGDEATLSRVSAALIQLSQRGRPGMKAVAANLRAKQAHLRHDKAAAKIQSLGGKLSGEGELEGIGIAGFEFGFVLPQLLDAAIDVAEVRPEAAGDDAVEDEPAIEEEGPLLVGEAGAPEQARDPDPPPALPEAGGPVPIEAADAGIADPFVGQDLLNAIGEEVVGAEAGESLSETLVLDAEWRGGDKGLAVLRELPNIVSVSLNDAKLTDLALGHIATLPKLGHFSVEGKTGITAEGLTRFRKARPATQVYARGEALLGVNAEMSGPCVLSSVANGSGAFEAGLKPGDEIVSVGGLKVGDFSDLTIAVFTHKAGEKLVVEYRRDGERKKVDVVLKARGAIERVQP